MKKSNEIKQLNKIFDEILKSDKNVLLRFIMINSTEFYTLQQNIKNIEEKLFKIIKGWKKLKE